LDKDSPAKLAKELKLDEAKFKSCFEGTKVKAIVEKGRAEGERIGVSGTPYIIINDHRYVGAHTVEAMTKEIESALR
jgi:protein-disulfide isomerase